MSSTINNIFINNVGKRPIDITTNNIQSENKAGVLICNYSCDLRINYNDISPNDINILNTIGKPNNSDIKYICLNINNNTQYVTYNGYEPAGSDSQKYILKYIYIFTPSIYRVNGQFPRYVNYICSHRTS